MRGHSGDIRRQLEREVEWISALCSGDGTPEERVARFMQSETESGGGSLQVVEMTGEPGDVVFMNALVLHAGAPQCGERPRMMLTERIWRKAAMRELASTFGRD